MKKFELGVTEKSNRWTTLYVGSPREIKNVMRNITKKTENFYSVFCDIPKVKMDERYYGLLIYCDSIDEYEYSVVNASVALHYMINYS